MPRRVRGRRRAARAAAGRRARAAVDAACAATVALCAADALTRPLSELEWSGGLRPVVLFCFAPAARDALTTCARVMPGVLAVVALELYVVLVYACLCVMLYGADGGKGDGGEGGSSPFGSLSDAFVALFALSTTVNDPDVWLRCRAARLEHGRRLWLVHRRAGVPSCAASCSRVGVTLSPPLSLSGLPRAQPRARDRVQHVRREPRRAARPRAPAGSRGPRRRRARRAAGGHRASRAARSSPHSAPCSPFPAQSRGAVRHCGRTRAARCAEAIDGGGRLDLHVRARWGRLTGQRRQRAAAARRLAALAHARCGSATRPQSSSRARAGGAPGRAASCGSCSRRSRSSRPWGRPSACALGWRVCLGAVGVVALASARSRARPHSARSAASARSATAAAAALTGGRRARRGGTPDAAAALLVLGRCVDMLRALRRVPRLAAALGTVGTILPSLLGQLAVIFACFHMCARLGVVRRGRG